MTLNASAMPAVDTVAVSSMLPTLKIIPARDDIGHVSITGDQEFSWNVSSDDASDTAREGRHHGQQREAECEIVKVQFEAPLAGQLQSVRPGAPAISEITRSASVAACEAGRIIDIVRSGADFCRPTPFMHYSCR